ncbi:chromosomal replication initiator protein DnaA, partial [Aestuariivirga sp.]|uniref:chromosomal replication initiator protein DnaA n=1 Tax=Aestuariivirga sp. TaxID=2650926 RepID=UPI003782F3ED
MKKRWDRVAQRLRAELGEDLYTSWFARMEIEELSSGRLVVSVPTRFLKSWIETHYVSRLQKIGEAELGPFESLVVRVRTRGGLTAVRPVQEDHAVAAQPAVQSGAVSPVLAAVQAAADRAPQIDPSQTFETFVVGPSNQLAHAAMCRVAEAAPGSAVSFNPLFVHAGSGLGKTHLLSAVAHRVRERWPDRMVMFLTAERFMINFVMALRQRDTLAFKDQFAAVDVLLIDDFQFLQGKTMQQEFCNAFNSLVDSRRQVIVAADVPPAQLDAIDQRMRSRLMGGLVVDIESPDLETRRRILASRYETMLKRDPAVLIPPEVLEFVANRIVGSGRELEGALNRIAAYQQFNQAAVTL